MKRKILLFIFSLILVLTGITNIKAIDKYEGDYTIEYLLKNYNVVTLGTKESYGFTSVKDNSGVNGSITNVFDIGGPVLVRGNYTGTKTLENEFAQKTDGIPSYIKGKLGSNVRPGSVESAEISNIYVGNNNNVYKSDDVYVVNKTIYKYAYPVYRTNNYINFDNLYASIVNEQKNISLGNRLVVNDPTLLMKYNKYLTGSNNDIIITEPGNYNIGADYVSKVYIFDYNPNETYIITNSSKYIYQMPNVEVRYSDGKLYDTAGDAVYCGRKNGNEDCTGNIIWNFPEARYVKSAYSTIGHIIAPKADVELLESHYAGGIIANSILSYENKKTAIQFYPYTLDKNISTSTGDIKTCVTEIEDSDSDAYEGNYSIDELLKNYSVVTLGQNEYSPNTKLLEHKAPKGTTNIFHIVGGFLINGNLGIEGNDYIKKNQYSYSGMKLEFRYTDRNYANSFLKGNLGNDAHLVTTYKHSSSGNGNYNSQYFNTSYLSSSRFIMNSNTSYVTNKDKARAALGVNLNRIDYGGWFNAYNSNNYPSPYHEYDDSNYYTITDTNTYFQDNKTGNYMLFGQNIYSSLDNYINFKKLYNSIIEQQSRISQGSNLTKNSSGELIIPIGGNYTIDNLDNIDKIKFSNWSKNKTSLTIITITDPDSVNFPKLYDEGNNLIITNDYYGRCDYGYCNPIYPDETVVPNTYYGNIVWNLPNATYIKLADNAPFVGHIIAPKADVETPELHFAGAMIVNSLYSEGYTEAHFYPLTVGSVGTGVSKKSNVVGTCDIQNMTINGTVKWNDSDNINNTRPADVTVNLLADGKKVDSITISEKDDWKYAFKDVSRLNNAGNKINYTININKIDSYETLISGYIITNTYQPKRDSLTLEYLLRNYNVVTLGTKDIFSNSIANNKKIEKGSVTNIFDIGGPVLIRGNYISSPNLENEFAQKTNGIPSYIGGTLGDNVTPGSKEYADISDIYVGKRNTVYKSGNVNIVNNTTFKYEYPVFRTDDYINFDNLYAKIVNEQKTIDEGNQLLVNDPTILMKYNKYLNSSLNNIVISEPGNYTFDSSTIDKIYIFDYNPNETYIINNTAKYIYEMPKIEIRYSDGTVYDTDGDAVYCGRKDENEVCSGNIIWNFPNARYVKTDYSTIGHIIAPSADIELYESHYAGTIIANSITSFANKKTAIQFYPYNVDKNLITEEGNSCIVEEEDLDNDIYVGSYSLDELLRNYSVVSLGQKEHGKNTKLYQYNAPKGTTNIFHIAGGLLINGNLGVKEVEYEAKNISTLPLISNLYAHNYTYPGIRLDFRYTDVNSANSYLRGKLESHAYLTDNYGYKSYNYGTYLNSAKFYVSPDFKLANKNEAQAVFKLTSWTDSFRPLRDMDPNSYIASNNKYMLMSRDIHANANNYMNFERLYNSVIEQQQSIEEGTKLSKTSSGELVIPIGGNYTIDSLKDISKIKFNNFSKNKDELTVITIKDVGSVNFPQVVNQYGGLISTNDWNGRWNTRTYTSTYWSDGHVTKTLDRYYSNEKVNEDTYYGNIVWNLPDATYIKLSPNAPFVGHVIAPNADVETPELNFAGAMIVNSLYSEGHSEAHFYPLTVGSVGTGVSTKKKSIGNCSEEKTKISGKVYWKQDEENETRPKTVTINLLADGKTIDSVVVSPDNNWEYEFQDISKFTVSGKEINYTITQNNLLDYSTLVSKYNVTNTYKTYKDSYSLEYLLRNYNVVTLGTRDPYKETDTKVYTNVKGSVTNVFDIGGPVLIRGNYTSTPTYDNEFAQKTNQIPSYIKGKLGDSVTPGSKEYADISDIYVGTSNSVHKNDENYVVNQTSYDYNYPTYRNDELIDFDKLYASVVNEQKNLKAGISYNNSNNIVNIQMPGTFNLTSSSLNKIYIDNYDPNELYILKIDSKMVNQMPEIEIRYSDGTKYDTDGDSVYCGRKDKNEICSGNIIWSFPNARYIKTDYSTIGHIVAPNADIELLESHYPSSIIANSIISEENRKTAIQFYPYSLDTKLVTTKGATCVTRFDDSYNNEDVYEGNYSIDELLKNYSIVSLGQKDYNSKAKLSRLYVNKGTTNIFHIVGGFLINGDLGVKNVNYEKRNKDAISGIKLEFRFQDSKYANSFVKGNLGTNVHTVQDGNEWESGLDRYNTPSYLRQTKLYVSSDIEKTDDILKAQQEFNVHVLPDFLLQYSNTSRPPYSPRVLGSQYLDAHKYAKDKKTSNYFLYDNNTLTHNDNYIDFNVLYNSIVKQQQTIQKGTVVRPDSSGIVTIPIGGYYTIENIASVKRVRFTSYDDNKTKLTVVSINDGGSINLPFEVTNSYDNYSTNDYYNRWSYRKYSCDSSGKNCKLVKNYPDEYVEEETYYGNIVFNIPNANYIKFASNNSFKGHVIAPNADVEMPEMNFAGAMIVNSLYAEGHSEAHFYPLTVGSIAKGTSITKETTIGTCSLEEQVTVSGTKIWNDNDNQDGLRPENITINLLADGVKVDKVTVDSSTDWNYSFKNISKRNSIGKIINYTITENPVDNYTTMLDGYNITNSYTPKKTSLTVNKVWDDEDNKNGARPDSIEIQLYADGEKLGDPVKIDEDNNWMYIFNELDMYSDSKKIAYTVKEVTKVDSYTTKITGSQEEGYTITNTYIVKEEPKEEIKDNPLTLDNITKFTLASVILSVLLIISIILFTRLKRKEN